MNIFYLDENPKMAAAMQTDKHIVKMILESAQLLCTAHRVIDGEHYIDDSSGRRLQRWRHPKYDDKLYKATHFNHPCSLWLRESADNYIWLFRHFQALSREYEIRYKKVHKSWSTLNPILSFTPEKLPRKGFTTPALAMPDQYKCGDPVQSYRNYYEAEKLKEQKDIDRYRLLLESEKIIQEYSEAYKKLGGE